MNLSSDSEEELFPIPIVINPDVNPGNDFFRYDDPLMVSGVIRAVVEEDLEKIKFMVKTGRSLNINDNNGNTPLHVAVIKNNLQILEYLLAQEDTLVNTRNFRGETPLFQAVHNGKYECARKLIQAGANVNLPNNEDVTPLHVSVAQPNLAHLLVVHGANINVEDYNNDTPLHDAVAECCLETVCMFLYYNADVNSVGGNNLTPFMKALIAETQDIQRALFEYVDDFNTATEDHMTTLALALTHDTPFVKEIIERGANVNFTDLYPNENVLCSFSLCLRVPNPENFRLIWDKLHYNEERNCINLVAIFEYLQRDDLEKYIDVIIESDNVTTAVQSLTNNDNFSFFITKFVESNLTLEQLTKLTCRLVLYGYQLNTFDINAIFYHYGYCELFKILLYMDNKYSYGWHSSMVVPRIIFDFKCTFNDILENFDGIPKEQLKKLFEYVIYPPLIKLCSHKFKDSEEMIHIIHNLPQVPSLVELARNKSREYIAESFKIISVCQFYTTINYLNMSSVYKKILTFEKKLYKIISNTPFS